MSLLPPDHLLSQFFFYYINYQLHRLLNSYSGLTQTLRMTLNIHGESSIQSKVAMVTEALQLQDQLVEVYILLCDVKHQSPV